MESRGTRHSPVSSFCISPRFLAGYSLDFDRESIEFSLGCPEHVCNRLLLLQGGEGKRKPRELTPTQTASSIYR